MKMVHNALSIGSIAGIPIRLHISLLLMVVLFALASGSGMGFFAVILLSFGIFGSVALHELGHSLMARVLGSHIYEIVLYPFGGVARIGNIPKKPEEEILVALAGPAVTLFLALILSLFGGWLGFLARLNWMLFFFNLIPAFPMDGGRVFRSVLAVKKGRLEATRIAAQVGKYFSIFFVVFGLFNGQFLLAFIGGYLYFAGKAEYRMVLMEYQGGNVFWGAGSGGPDVEVGPPPYGRKEEWQELFRRMFRR